MIIKLQSYLMYIVFVSAEINKLEKTLSKLVEEKDKIEQDLTDLQKEISKKKDEITSIENNRKEIKRDIEKIEKNLEVENYKRNSMKEDIKKWSSTITNMRSRITNYLIEKHNLLLKCKVCNFH